jgi:hypothetical protein
MNSLHKGQIAELKVTVRALEKGYIVSKPVIEARYDLLIDDGKTVQKAQVKYADGGSSHSSGAVTVHLRHWKGNEEYQTRTYQAGDVDVLLVYLPKIDKVVRFSPDQFCGKRILTIRLEPAKSGRKAGVWFADQMTW